MAIVVGCRCGRKFKTKDEYAGRQAKCPACGEVLDIPAAEDEVQVESEERYGPEAEDEDELSPAEEARRQRKLKAARDAQIRKRYNVIAIASVAAMVLLSVIWWFTRGETGAGTDKKGDRDKKATSGSNERPPSQPKVVESAPGEIPPPPSGEMDEVERYIQWAVLAKDSAIKANAMVFKPDDPRLKFQANWRRPKDGAAKAKASVLASFLDLELGPQPSAATDQIEARMLMDQDLVGTSIMGNLIGDKSFLYVFLDPCKATMADVIKKYGPPAGPPLASGDSKVHFYGRIALIEVEGGKIHAVVRKSPKG